MTRKIEYAVAAVVMILMIFAAAWITNDPHHSEPCTAQNEGETRVLHDVAPLFANEICQDGQWLKD